MIKNTSVVNARVKKTRKKPSVSNNKSSNSPIAPDWRTHYEFWGARKLPMITLERLAENIITIIKEDKTIYSWNKVLLLCDVHPTQFKDFEERCPKLKASKKFAMFTIGVNREEKAITRQIDFSVMKHMQGIYDKSWAAQEERHAELRKNIASENATKIIVMSEFENKTKNKTSK